MNDTTLSSRIDASKQCKCAKKGKLCATKLVVSHVVPAGDDNAMKGMQRKRKLTERCRTKKKKKRLWNKCSAARAAYANEYVHRGVETN